MNANFETSSLLQSRTVINKSTNNVITDTPATARQQQQNGGAEHAQNGSPQQQNGVQDGAGPSFRSRLDFPVQPSSGHFRARSR